MTIDRLIPEFGNERPVDWFDGSGRCPFRAGQTFALLRRMVDLQGIAETDAPAWRQPPTVTIGAPTRLDGQFVGYNRRFNVHSGEKEGTWTSATDAHIQLKLSGPVVGKVRVRVRFFAAGGREGGLRC
jgi:hypothetical protein